MTAIDLPVAVVDSGIGGISVLAELAKLLPNENYIYFGDTANAPYGTKEASFVRERTFENFDLLCKKGIKAFVLACNTATSVAVAQLREKHPEMIIIGVEPALKPAVMCGNDPTVAVLATPLTLEENKFAALMARYSDNATIIPFPCPGLVEFAERGIFDGADIDSFLSELFAPLKERHPDCVVLGCTHYPLMKDAISKAIGNDAVFFDGGSGTARETQRRLCEKGLLRAADARGSVTFLDSAYPNEEDPKGSVLVRFGKEYLCR